MIILITSFLNTQKSYSNPFFSFKFPSDFIFTSFPSHILSFHRHSNWAPCCLAARNWSCYENGWYEYGSAVTFGNPKKANHALDIHRRNVSRTHHESILKNANANVSTEEAMKPCNTFIYLEQLCHHTDCGTQSINWLWIITCLAGSNCYHNSKLCLI